MAEKRSEENISELRDFLKSSRRGFLKGSLATGAGLVVGAAGITPAVASTASPQASEPCKIYGFETPPAPISVSAIKKTMTADVIVLGAGYAGLCAANAAADKGAKVIVLEKRSTYTTHGSWNASYNDRLHKSQNVTISRDMLAADLMRFGVYQPNARLHKLWLDESGRIMDKLMDIADENGATYYIDTDVKTHWPYTEFPIGINFLPKSNITLSAILEKRAKSKGVEILYDTPAAQLIRKNSKGNVSGVVGKSKDGYIQVNGKAVIICTGDYGSNQEMKEKYSPRSLKAINNQYAEGSNTGDGILMGMWVGGAKQETDCPMLWDGMIAGHGMFVGIARQPFLNVNILGERYANEDAPFGYTANADNEQPTSQKWTVWDAKWNTDKEKLHGTACENMHATRVMPFAFDDRAYQAWKSKGVIIEADTIEALGAKMNVPVDTFAATVRRYNELVAKGSDEDFGKDPEKLTSIIQPPFGAAKVGTGLLVTLDGLRVNTSLEVLDTQGKAISGLYAAGNASGDFFVHDYPITVMGVSLGRAYTFGWIAGENAAKVG